jgi:cell wall-associated NlpC family hydrolase
MDCSGFARKLYSDVYGIELTRTAQEQYKNSSRQKKRDNAEEGDLVFFKQRGKRITHVGVYLGNDYFVHSSTSQGVVISSLKEDYWRAHYVGMGKVSKDELVGDSSGE